MTLNATQGKASPVFCRNLVLELSEEPWVQWLRRSLAKQEDQGSIPSFFLSKGIMWPGNKLRNCQSVIVLCQRTQTEFKYLTLAVLPGAIKGFNKNSRGQKLNS